MVVGEFKQEAQLVVIVAGPAGYAAAFRAAELGMQTVIIDKRDQLGGACLHTACIPSKTLLHICEIIRIPQHAKHFGVNFQTPEIDLEQIQKHLTQTTAKLAAGLTSRAKALNIEIISGEAVFEDAKTIAVHGPDGNVRFKFKRAIIATGSTPNSHPAFPSPSSTPQILNPWQALQLESIPDRLLIVGSQSFTAELAQIYSTLGSRVTLCTESSNLIAGPDPDLLRPLARTLKSKLESIVLNTPVASSSFNNHKKTFRAEFAEPIRNQDESTFDAIILATGMRPNLDALNPEAADIQVESNNMVVNNQLKTTNPRVLAAGDVAGPPFLADRALLQGRIAAEVATGRNSVFDARVIPNVVFTAPQIAWVGLTQQDAEYQEIPHKMAKLPHGASGRAISMNQAHGLTKIIFDPDSRSILGVGIVGNNASEMIAEAALAIELGAELDDLARTIHPHPTVSELISDAAWLNE